MHKEQAVEQLKEYSRAKERRPFLEMKLQALQRRMERYPEKIRATMAVMARIEETVKADSMIIEDVESCLEMLDEREKRLLWHFYIHRTYDYIEILNEKLCVERSQIYRLKDKALEKYMMLSLASFY